MRLDLRTTHNEISDARPLQKNVCLELGECLNSICGRLFGICGPLECVNVGVNMEHQDYVICVCFIPES